MTPTEHATALKQESDRLLAWQKDIAETETDNMAWLRRAGEALKERPDLRADK